MNPVATSDETLIAGSVAEEELSPEAYLAMCRAGPKAWLSTRLGSRLARQLLTLGPGPYRAVEVGCGPGFLARAMAEEAKGAVRVLAVDVDPAMLELAQRENSFPHVEYRQCGQESLPVEDALADLVVSEDSLHHWSQPEAVLRQILRIAKPGACIFISDLNPRGLLTRLMLVKNRVKAVLGIRNPEDESFRLSVQRCRTKQELRALLSGAGLPPMRVGRGLLRNRAVGRKPDS